MATKTAALVRGRVARFTRLDNCGRLVYGPDSQVVTKGIVTVAYTVVVDEGEEINLKNFADETCVREPARPQFQGLTAEITFCRVDPELFAMATGQRVLYDAFGDAVGFSQDTKVIPADSAFALEVWSGASTGGVCPPGGQGQYGYFLLPFIQGGTIGDLTIENAEVTFTVTNVATRDGNQWGVGPYNVELTALSAPGPLVDPLTATEHFALKLVTVAPPTAHDGAWPLLDPAGVALTSVTATPDVTDPEAVFAPTPTGTDPWYVEVDGQFFYSANGGSITADLGTGGTYTWVAHRGTSTKTGTVTVPS